MTMDKNKLFGGIFGLAIGDALGVPVEGWYRTALKNNPVVDMREFGSHQQPKGTWSDDSSLTFCLIEALNDGYDLNAIATNFSKWKKAEIWTPHGKVFDIGIGTRNAIAYIDKGHAPDVCGGMEISDNGNGSLMRILPMAFYLYNLNDTAEIYLKIKQVSSITHAHFRSIFSCYIYTIYAIDLLHGKDKFEAYDNMKKTVGDFLSKNNFNVDEVALFDRIIKQDISKLNEEVISSSGYVLHSLEASFWCFLTTNSYEDAALKAVNLGHDTDTTGAIAGGLAGIYYGYDLLPETWKNCLVKKQAIELLCEKYYETIKKMN